MAIPWHREEPRDVRPFFHTRQAENALEDTGIRLFESGEVLSDTDFDLDEVDFQKLAPAIQPSLVDPALWMPESLTPDDLELVLIARHSFLKKSLVVAREAITRLEPGDWPVSPEVVAELGGGRNAQFVFALCLVADRAPSPGSPFIGGHWLARKSFSLRSRATPTLFDVRTRTDDEWIDAGYPAKTFYVVEYAGGIETEAEEGSSIATVYLHADAHNKMVGSPIGGTLQPVLATEIITTILQESVDDWKNIESAAPDTPLATVLKELGKRKAITLPELRSLIAQPSKLRAELQDRLSVLRAIT